MNLLTTFSNKTVLVTGHTGFKGSWLALWLEELGANVVGISSDIPTSPSHFSMLSFKRLIDLRSDILDLDFLVHAFDKYQPEFFFHLAAQPIVSTSYANPKSTFLSNSIGTLNVLEAIRHYSRPLTTVLITSDKVYRNNEWVYGYREDDVIAGIDPYSASKSCAEIIINSYLRSFFADTGSPKRFAIGRAGNVIGGGDWAADRIVPDAVRSILSSKDLLLRSPYSTRPWQHVLEPLSGYLQLAYQLSSDSTLHGQAFNFGPPADQVADVESLIILMQNYLPTLSYSITDNSPMKESKLLKLDCSKALHYLNWSPSLNFSETVSYTSTWYNQYLSIPSSEITDLTLSQIYSYSNKTPLFDVF